MDSITQNKGKENKNKRYLPHDLKTKENAVKTYLNNGDIGKRSIKRRIEPSLKYVVK